MTLRLVIEHSPSPQPRPEVTHVGGDLSIGRGTDCDWPIDDPDMLISRRHCLVSARDGLYLVTDSSRGGLFIDGSDQPLGAGNSRPLEHGMRLRLGDVVVRVEIAGNPSAAAPVSRLSRNLGADDFFSRPIAEQRPNPRPEGLPEPFESGRPQAGGGPPPRPAGPPAFDDPFTLDPVASRPAPTPDRPASGGAVGGKDLWGQSPPARPPNPGIAAAQGDRTAGGFGFDDIFAPPPRAEPASGPPGAADDWFSASSPAEPPLPPEPGHSVPRAGPPPPAPHPQAPPAATEAALFAAFLRGAGLAAEPPGLAATEAGMEAMGRRFRLLAEGLILLLRARAREKGTARLAQTVIGATDVNPLKFLPTTDEALAALIAPRGRGYLPPDEAIQAAFRDLSDHQMRSWLAIQSALRRMIDRFDPAAFETEVDQAGLMKALLAGGRGARLWQLYTERYRDIAKSAEDRFLGEVGTDFREAYETKGRTRDD